MGGGIEWVVKVVGSNEKTEKVTARPRPLRAYAHESASFSVHLAGSSEISQSPFLDGSESPGDAVEAETDQDRVWTRRE